MHVRPYECEVLVRSHLDLGDAGEISEGFGDLVKISPVPGHKYGVTTLMEFLSFPQFPERQWALKRWWC
jgi:hypothetical protein